MAPKVKIAGVRYKNIETALEAEEAALTVVHVAVNKQLKRLEVEEQLLQEMLRQAEQEQEHARDHPQQQQQQQ